MHFSTLLLGSGLAPLALAAYTIRDDYSGDRFFSMFSFFTGDDPTHGYVNYVDQATAQSNGLVSISNGVVTIKSDSTRPGAGRGRDSVRITSNNQYTHGLVILDLQHMPGSACGIWPAFWMFGPNWPNNGEIDIIEGVNLQAQNSMTMHTSGGCSLIGKDCYGHQGCGVSAGGPGSYGDGFNNGNGGVYALEWTSEAIDIWFFSRSSNLDNVLSDNPDPAQWGSPLASFEGGSGCTIDDHFNDHNIIFDTTFCGDWAGGVWSQEPTCSSKAPTCIDYVRDNPSAFTEAYWTINSLKVFTSDGNTRPISARRALDSSFPAAASVAQNSSASVTDTDIVSSKAAETKPMGLGSGMPAGTLGMTPVQNGEVSENLVRTVEESGGLLSVDETAIAAPSVAKRGLLEESSSRIMRHLRRHHHHHHHHMAAAIGQS